MTTRIKITNVGPENAAVWYYNEARQFEQHKDVLLVGQTIEMDIWDGKLPVVLPVGHATFIPETNKFYAIPPATY